jgi:hypothetical protein
MSSQYNLVVFPQDWPNQFCFFVCFVCTSVGTVTLDVTQTSSHQIWPSAHQAKNLFTRKLINIQTIPGCYHYCIWNSSVQGLSCHFFSLIDLFTTLFFFPSHFRAYSLPVLKEQPTWCLNFLYASSCSFNFYFRWAVQSSDPCSCNVAVSVFVM